MFDSGEELGDFEQVSEIENNVGLSEIRLDEPESDFSEEIDETNGKVAHILNDSTEQIDCNDLNRYLTEMGKYALLSLEEEETYNKALRENFDAIIGAIENISSESSLGKVSEIDQIKIMIAKRKEEDPDLNPHRKLVKSIVKTINFACEKHTDD